MTLLPRGRGGWAARRTGYKRAALIAMAALALALVGGCSSQQKPAQTGQGTGGLGLSPMNGLDAGSHNFGDIGAGKAGQRRHAVPEGRQPSQSVGGEQVVDHRPEYKIPDKNLDHQGRSPYDLHVDDRGPFKGRIGG